MGAMPKFSQGTAALVALAAFALWLFVVLPLLYYPRYESPNKQNGATQSEGKPDSGVPPFIPYKIFTEAGRDEIAKYCGTDDKKEKQDWAHKYICDVRITDSYIALFTGLLMAVTIGLIGVGYFTLHQMRVAEQRELRAYIGVVILRETISQLNPNTRPRVPIVIKNFGQTPAYDVEVTTNIVPAEFPRSGALPFAGEESGEGSRTIIHPGQELHTDCVAEKPLDAAEANRLRTESATRRLYLHGEVTYRDVFRKRHTTNFRLNNDGSGATFQRFGHSQEGNTAD
jgi:hypothetical protein